MIRSLINKSSNLYLIILIIGFFFIGVVPKIFGLTEGSIAVPFRAFILVVSIFLILSILLSRKVPKLYLNRYFLFFVFWFLYTIRIFYDLFVINIILAPNKKPIEYLQFAFGVVFIPSLCVILITQAKNIDYDWLLKWVYRILFFTLCVALYSRGNSNLVGRDAGDINVGIIMFGQYGTTLSLLSLFYLTKKDKDFKKNIFYIFGFILGFMGVFVSASKSPLLALILVSLLFLFLWYGSVKSLLLLLTLGIIIYVFFADILFFLNDIFKSSLIERILYAIEVGGDKTREKYFATAFNEFIDNPIFGNAMLIQEYSISGNYPHNLILEALMSIGFMGGITIMLWIAKCIRGFYLNCKKHSANTWISLLFMQYLVFSMFSGNIFSNNLFWIFSVLVIGVNYKSITNEKYKRDNV